MYGPYLQAYVFHVAVALKYPMEWLGKHPSSEPVYDACVRAKYNYPWIWDGMIKELREGGFL